MPASNLTSTFRRLPTLFLGLALAGCTSFAPPQQPYSPARGPAPASSVAQPAGPMAIPRSARVLRLRAEALFTANKPVQATALLVRREQYLQHLPIALQRNRDDIWDGLMSRALTQANTGSLQQADQTTRGWIKLAQLAQRGASLRQYEQWQKNYPDHPAAARLPALMMPSAGPWKPKQAAGNENALNALYSAPVPGNGPAALILPVNGSLHAAAKLVLSGYQAAQNQLDAGQPPAAVYDDSGANDAVSAYQQATGNGAGIVVGPLQKPAVAQLVQQGVISTPVLALNYLDTTPDAAAQSLPESQSSTPPLTQSTPPPTGLLQFGLSPEDEARQAADNAFAHGLQRAVALVPDTPKGSRTLAAFSQRLQELGGSVAASAQYTANTSNFSPQVRSLLGINQSIARDHAVANALSYRPKFQPRRRGDIDFIFISGNPTEARLMTTMFRFWHAAHLPIYATADASTGKGSRDLAGVRFCTDPWLLEPGPQWKAVRARIEQASGNRTGYARLYALGMDAARLVHRLRQGPMLPGEEVVGYTGDLSIGHSGIVRRHLACARISADGPPQPLDNPALPVPNQSPLTTTGSSSMMQPVANGPVDSTPSPFPGAAEPDSD